MILIHILYLNYDIKLFERNAKVINKFKRSSVDTIYLHIVNVIQFLRKGKKY